MEFKNEESNLLLNHFLSVCGGEDPEYFEALTAFIDKEYSKQNIIEFSNCDANELKAIINRHKAGALEDNDLRFLIDYSKKYLNILKNAERPEALTPIEAFGVLNEFYEDPENFEEKTSGKYKKGIYQEDGQPEIAYLIDVNMLEYWRSINTKTEDLYNSNVMQLDPIIMREKSSTPINRDAENYLIYKPNNNSIAWGFTEDGGALDISDIMGYQNTSTSYNIISWIEETLENYKIIGRPKKISQAKLTELLAPYRFNEDYQSNVAISLKKYEGALDAKKNPYAYITVLSNRPFFLKMNEGKFGGISGELIPNSLSEKQKDEYTVKALNEADTAILRNIFGIVLERERAGANINEPITLDVMEFAETFGIRFEINLKKGKEGAPENEEARDSNRRDLSEILDSLDKVWGVINEKSYSRAFVLLSFDNKYISFLSPYSSALISIIKNHPLRPAIELESGYTKPEVLGLNFLMKSTITASRAPDTTKEVIKTITNNILQKGQQRKKKGEIKEVILSLESIIEQTPLLEHKLNGAAENKFRTRILKRTIYGQSYKPGEDPILIKTLKEYTKVYEKYQFFEIELPEIISYKNLEASIKVRFL